MCIHIRNTWRQLEKCVCKCSIYSCGYTAAYYVFESAERKQCIIFGHSSVVGLELLFPRRYVPHGVHTFCFVCTYSNACLCFLLWTCLQCVLACHFVPSVRNIQPFLNCEVEFSRNTAYHCRSAYKCICPTISSCILFFVDIVTLISSTLWYWQKTLRQYVIYPQKILYIQGEYHFQEDRSYLCDIICM